MISMLLNCFISCCISALGIGFYRFMFDDRDIFNQQEALIDELYKFGEQNRE